MDLIHVLSPIDILVGFLSFFAGIAAMLKKYGKNPLRNAGLFLQISLMLVKMAQHYFDTHPDAREKLNDYTVKMLEKVSRQLENYSQASTDASQMKGPLG